MHRVAIIVALLLLPFPALAVEPAGFAPGAIWFSKLPLYSNKKVTVYSALYNGTPNKLSGRLEFLDAGRVFGGSAFSLEAGASNIISADWTPEEGAHNISARIADAEMITESGERISITLESAAASELQLTAVPAPVTPLQSGVNHADTKTVATLLNSVAPAVGSVVIPILQASDSLRDKGVAALSENINELRDATDEPKTETASSLVVASSTEAQVSGTTSTEQTTNEASQQVASVSGFKHFLIQIWIYIQYAFYYMLKYSYLYYPIVAFLFFFLVRILYSRLVVRRG